jgi:hypothetical protein
MKTFVYKTERYQVIETVTCNKCGKKVRDNFDSTVSNTVHYMTIKWNWGYGADNTLFGDMTALDMDICEPCMYEWVKTFKINPAFDMLNYREFNFNKGD